MPVAWRGLTGLFIEPVSIRRRGADVIFPEALRTRHEFEAFSSYLRSVHMLANMTEFGISPGLKFGDLARMGYDLVLYP